MGCTPCQARARAARARRLADIQKKKAEAEAKKKAESYVLILDGRTQTFGSRLEADAENARNGYAGQVKVVR